MDPVDIQNLEARVSRLEYPDIGRELNGLSDAALLELLNSRSIKVGDSAASILRSRGRTDAVVDAILSGKLRTKLGKIRGTYILHSFGRGCSRSVEAYLALLHDRSVEVVSDALFGLVFLQDERNTTHIQRARAEVQPGGAVLEYFDRAVEALRKQDPFIFSPYFRDVGDVWGLDRERFGDRIGPG